MQLYLHGVQAWQLKDSAVKDMYTMHNHCTRRILNVPYKTHTRFFSLLTGRPTCETSICKRVLKLINCMLSSRVDSIRFLAMLCVWNANSICGGNMNFIKRNHGVVKKKHIQMTVKTHADIDIATVQAIKDLRHSNVGLSCSESNEFIAFLCTKWL